MPVLSNRVGLFTESIIRRMTRISNLRNAVNLSQGFPDFDPPPELRYALKKVSEDGPHQYAITWGAPEFRKALAEKQEKFMGIPVDPEKNIVVTCGSTEAMIAAMLTVCNTSNPSGKVFSIEELMVISRLAVEFDVFVITDEVYEHIVYKPYKHVYIASLPGMSERTISCSSLSKTYSITGWRLGYIIAPGYIIDSARKVHDFLTVGAAAPLQEAAIAGLTLSENYYKDLRNSYTGKREIFLKMLDEAGIKYTRPQGAYYVMCDISEFGSGSDIEFCEWMAMEVGVGAVPGSSFFRTKENRYIRFHFAKKEETLRQAGVRLLTLRDKALAKFKK
ncbi:MAG: aminotransferase class I/II-fold pyridoxal phosphate-dependent enzyme [Brevinematales bacterium]|jgi:aminotransferase